MNAPDDPTRTLQDHLADCADCVRERLPVEKLDAILRSSSLPFDPADLTRRSLPILSQALARQTAEPVWRPVLLAVLASLLPLAAVVVYDVWVLQVFHTLLDAVLPSRLAAWIVINYAAGIVLMLSATYAAIPLFVARQREGYAVESTTV